MINLENKLVIIRKKNPRICLALIGLPQFSITLEHRYDKEIGWTTALCLIVLAVFISWDL